MQYVNGNRPYQRWRMPERNCVGNINQLKFLPDNLNRLWNGRINHKLLVEIKLFCKGLVVIDFEFAMLGFAASFLFLCTATTAFAFFLLPVKCKILENFTAIMVRYACAANICGE